MHRLFSLKFYYKKMKQEVRFRSGTRTRILYISASAFTRHRLVAGVGGVFNSKGRNRKGEGQGMHTNETVTPLFLIEIDKEETRLRQCGLVLNLQVNI